MFALTLMVAAPAAAESVKFEALAPAPQPTYVYFEGDMGGSGEFILCVNNKAVGGVWNGGTDGDPYTGGACPAVTSPQTVSLPPSGGGGGTPEPPSGDELPEPPCEFPTGCLDQVAAAFGCASFDQSCLEQHTGGGDGGGGGAPAPPEGAPAPRDCASASGGGAVDATCFGTEDMYFLGKAPGDGGAGEIGICAGEAGYFYGTGPDGADGGAGGPCPTAAAAAPAPSGGGGSEPAPDKDGDGVADSGDRCPTVAASTADGCPPQSSGGTEQSSGGTQTTSGGTQQSRSGSSSELPRIDITRRRLGVSRRGKVAIPLKCQTFRAICRGTLTLTATRRTKSGRRVRVVLARAEFLVPAGGSLQRKVRLTRAGRALLATKGTLRANAKFVMASYGGKITRRDRVVLRRR